MQAFCQDEVWQMLGLLPHLPHKREFRVANSGGSARFATREVLAQLEIGCQLLICVANVGSTAPFATQIPKTCGKQRSQCQICHTNKANPAGGVVVSSWALLNGCS